MTDDLAARLLEAQIAFTRRELLSPENFHHLVVDEVEAFLAHAAQITLREAVTPDMIKATAHKYAVSMPLEASIPELAGEIAARIYRHPANDRFRIVDVIDERRFDELVSAVAETAAAQRILRAVLESPETVDVCVEVVVHALDRAVTDRPASRARTALTRTLTAVTGPIAPAIASGVERLTRAGARYVLEAADDDTDTTILVDAARRIWRSVSGDEVGRFRELVTADDIEDIVVVAFEFWKSYRDTEHFAAMLDEGIEHVFDKYGDVTLVDLLADLGIGRADLIEEGLRFGPPVLALLDDRGVLDEVLRRRLVPFYDSPEFRAALA